MQVARSEPHGHPCRECRCEPPRHPSTQLEYFGAGLDGPGDFARGFRRRSRGIKTDIGCEPRCLRQSWVYRYIYAKTADECLAICTGWSPGRLPVIDPTPIVKDTDIEKFQFELSALYTSTKGMPGSTRYLQKLKQDMEAAEPAQVQSERKSKQPTGWTTQMTEFVEGSLYGGNDVTTTVNLFRKDIVDAFDIRRLTEHVEKLKNKLVRKNNALANQHQVPPAPLGWNDRICEVVSFLNSLEVVAEGQLNLTATAHI